MHKVGLFLTAAGLSLAASTASAATVTLNGITFSEQTPAVTITSGSGTGSAADPFVLNETVSDMDVTIGIQGLASSGLSEVGAFSTGFHLTKIVTNATAIAWSFFDNELQEILGTPSPDGDGLSFAQDFAGARPFTSDRFTSVFEDNDARDQVSFFDGLVNPGETVTMSYAITDNSPVDAFFLRQRPNFKDPGIAPIPVPAALPMLLAGFGLMAAAARRRRAP